jgi:hypothetical protein
MSPKGHAFGSLDSRPYETPSRACRDDPCPALSAGRSASAPTAAGSRLSKSRPDSEVRITRNADIDRARNLITILPLAGLWDLLFESKSGRTYREVLAFTLRKQGEERGKRHGMAGRCAKPENRGSRRATECPETDRGRRAAHSPDDPLFRYGNASQGDGSRQHRGQDGCGCVSGGQLRAAGCKVLPLRLSLILSRRT